MRGACSAPGLCKGVAFGVIRGDDLAFLINFSVGFLTSVALGVEGFFGVLWTFGSGGFESFVNFTSPTRSATTTKKKKKKRSDILIIFMQSLRLRVYNIYVCNFNSRHKNYTQEKEEEYLYQKQKKEKKFIQKNKKKIKYKFIQIISEQKRIPVERKKK